MHENPNLSLQERYAPNGICFGCGVTNAKGLRIRSFLKTLNETKSLGQTDSPNHQIETIAQWTPQEHHQAFPGVLNGGIIGALLDCHANWAAAIKLMHSKGLDCPPCTVTADYAIKLLRPTPCDSLLTLSARVTQIKGDRAMVAATLSANEKVCATCEGTFVAVKPGHPAYHRW